MNFKTLFVGFVVGVILSRYLSNTKRDREAPPEGWGGRNEVHPMFFDN